MDPQNKDADAANFPSRAPLGICFMRIDDKSPDPKHDFGTALKARDGTRRVDNSDLIVRINNMGDVIYTDKGEVYDPSQWATEEEVNAMLGYDPNRYPPPKRIYDDGRPLTEEEAREMLENSPEITASCTSIDGFPEHSLVGECYTEEDGCFAFAVYPYTAKTPIDPT